MKFSKRSALAASLVVLGPVAAVAASEPDTIVVSASRTPLSIAEIGSSVTVIDSDEIGRRHARSVLELLDGVPGIAVSRSGATGAQAQVRVRGAEANHLLVLIDGVEANDPATGDEFRFEYLSTDAIERIEIVRGPHSALWGSEAVAGVINIITRAERPSGGGAYVEGGSHDTFAAGGDLALATRDWSFALAGGYLDTAGTNASRTGNEKDGSDLGTASVAIRYGRSEDLTFDFGWRLADGETEFDPIDFFVTGLPTDGDRSNTSRRETAHATVRHRFADSRLRQSVGINWFDSADDTWIDGALTDTADADRRSLRYQFEVHREEDRYTFAIEREMTRFRQTGAIVFGDPNQSQSMTVTSAVAEYVGRFLDDVTVTLGARFDRNSDFDDAASARASASWQVNDATRLRFNAGSGRKSPTFTERFGFFPGQFVGNPSLEPERSVSWELGVARRIANDLVDIDIAVFSQDLTDEINGFVFDPASFLFTARNEDGDSRRQGAELAANYRPQDWLALSASYTYVDATEEVAAGRFRDEIRRPRHQGHIGAAADLLSDRLSLTLTARYGGERLDRFFPPFPEPPRDVVLGARWLVDLSASLRLTPSLHAYGRIVNALDENYEEVLGYRTLPRSVYVGLRYRPRR